MGFYYENGKSCFKAESLIKEHNANIIGPRRARKAIEEGTTAVVCVFQNAHFDAACYCYDIDEFERCYLPAEEDPRVRTILEVPDKELIEKLTKFDKSRIAAEKKSHLYN